jgi:hypothetical protein
MSTNQHNPKFVGKVRVWHRTDDGNNDTFVGLHNENQLISISAKARDDLATQHSVPKVWTLEHMNKRALDDVLSQALRFGPRLHLNGNGKSMLDLIQMLNVVERLRIRPRQKQIEGHLVHLLTHSPITPVVMVAAHKCFRQQGGDSRAWRVMVHQIAFDVAHDNLTAARLEELNAAATPYADLDNAVKDRIAYLKGCREHKEAMQQKKEQGREVKQQKHEPMDHRKRGARKPSPQLSGPKTGPKKTFETLHEKNEKIWFEEENGLRTASESTVAYIKQQKPGGFWITPKLNQRQRKLLDRARLEARNGRASFGGEEGS